MKKILIGLGAAIIIAAAGYFGFDFYVQHRVKGEVEAAFAQIRAAGAKASYGAVAFDVRSRTVTIADIGIESGAEPPLSVKVANVTLSGVSQAGAARFSADSIDVGNVEVAFTMPAPARTRLTYNAPHIVAKAYSGPASVRRLPASSSLTELYRFGLEQLAEIAAASITAPDVTGTVTFDAPARGGVSDGEFVYSGFAMEGLKDGKIASMTTASVSFRVNVNQPANPFKQITGDLANLVARDIDVGALAALFDPGKANDDREHRVYGHLSAGPYVIASPQGLNIRIEGFTAENVGLTPSRMRLPALMTMIPPPGAAPPTPAQAREMMESVASLYEGVRVGNAAMSGIAVDTPQGPVKLKALQFNFANGKIDELAIEGLEGQAPRGPVKLGRFALKSLDVAGFMRMAAQSAGQQPSAEQALALLQLLEGVEIKALAAPYKTTGKQIDIETLKLDWGQFVGPIPSRLRLIAKMSAPLDPSDVGQQALVAAGIDAMTIDADLGAAWTEASRAFALEPVKLEIGGLLNASLRTSFANLPREAFSVSAAQAMGAATQIEAGAIEFTVHDLGFLDLAVAQQARTRNVSRDVARQAIVQTIRGAETPDALKPAVDALVNFVETPGQTLVIKLTPLAKAPVLQLIQLLKTEPLLALMQFRIEASTGL